MSLKIKYVKPKEIKGFYGMNPEAAKHFHFKNYPKNYILIDSKLGAKKRKQVKIHEFVEYNLMHNNHYSYVKADRIASKMEKSL